MNTYEITGQIWITHNEYMAITPETRTLTEEQIEREYGPRRKADSPAGTQYRSLPNFAGSRKTRETVLTPKG